MIPHLLEQHATEAAVLWVHRRVAVGAPHYSLQDLADLDKRINKHLDGLRVGKDAGWTAALEAASSGEPGDLFPASLLAFENGDSQRIAAAMESLDAAPEALPGLASSLGWLPFDKIEKHLDLMLESSSPLRRAAGLLGFVLHRQNAGPAFTRALADPDAALRARALRSVGELGRRDLVPALQKAFTDEDPQCRAWALWSAVLLGDTHAIGPLKATALLGSKLAEPVLQVLMRRMDTRNASDYLHRLSRTPGCERLAIQAAGILGDPANLPWLLDHMQSAPLARIAGEAFTRITGVDLALEDLEQDAPEDFEAGPTEDPRDENVALDDDEDLPWPSPPLIQAWMQRHGGSWNPGSRCFLGKAMGEDYLQTVLQQGFQRHRRDAALELAIRCPGTPLFNTSAPGFRQKTQIPALI